MAKANKKELEIPFEKKLWETADKLRKNVAIDWTIKESARADLMTIVRRTLRKNGYPPDKQEKAVETVLKHAALMADYYTK